MREADNSIKIFCADDAEVKNIKIDTLSKYDIQLVAIFSNKFTNSTEYKNVLKSEGVADSEQKSLLGVLAPYFVMIALIGLAYAYVQKGSMEDDDEDDDEVNLFAPEPNSTDTNTEQSTTGGYMKKYRFDKAKKRLKAYRGY